MRLNRLNHRITFVSIGGGKNDDGEYIENQQVDEFTCWAEITKAPLKEFRERDSGLEGRQETLTVVIRYLQEKPIDTSWRVRFNGVLYEITDLEKDYSFREIQQLKIKRVIM